MNIFKKIINLYKDYSQKEKVMAKAYEEITEKMKDGITLADQIVDVLKENKKLKEQLNKAKEIIKILLQYDRGQFFGNRIIYEKYMHTRGEAEQFLKCENIILEDAQAGNSPFDADEVFNKEMKAYPEEK